MNKSPLVKAKLIATELSPATAFEHLKGWFNVEYEDGVIRHIHAKTIHLSLLYWRVCVEFGIPIRNEICYGYLHEKKSEVYFSTNSNQKLVNMIVLDYRNKHNDISPEWNKNLAWLLQSLATAASEMYSLFVEYAAHYVTTVNINDYTEIALDEELLAKKEEIRKAIPHIGHNQVKEMVNELLIFGENLIQTKYKDSQIASAVQSGLIKTNQLHQVLIARGVASDVDKTEFKKPILSSYTEGIQELADAHAEIKGAAIAIEAQKNDLENAEYDNRKIQIVMMSLERVHHVDCGSERTRTVFVENQAKLECLDGKFYIPNKGDKPVRICSDQMKHLIGQYIRIRSLLAGCNHPDTNGFCAVCAGDLVQWAPPINIGHWITAMFNARQVQGILSTKHFITSAAIADLDMGKAFHEWFEFDPHVEYILLKPRPIKGSLKIVFDIKDVPGHNIIFSDTDEGEIHYPSIASLKKVTMEIEYENKVFSEPVKVAESNKHPSWTQALVDYIREDNSRLEIVPGKRISIDCNDWDHNEPMFSVPMKVADVTVFQKEITHILHANNSKTNRKTVISPVDAVDLLYKTIDGRFEVSMTVLEMLIYAYCARDPLNGDYGLPKGDDEFHHMTGNAVIQNRSLGAASAFQGMCPTLLSPKTFLQNKRLSSPYDWMMVPHLATQVYDNSKHSR